MRSPTPLQAHHDPHSIFILPALLPPRLDGLTLVALADGNRRGSADSGYGRGARRVVAVAEHLARRPEVGTLVVCLLSPENLARRGEGFFQAMYQEFVRLGVAIAAGGALVAAGVRAEIGGDLAALRARGGYAAALADAAEAVAATAAARVERPRLRLVLVLGYGPETTGAYGADIVLRTGMEDDNALRLSGLRTHPGVSNHATTTLWPDISARELDEVIETARRRASPRLASGHDPETVVALAAALAGAAVGAPVRVTIATAAPAEEIERLNLGPLRGSAVHAVERVAGGDFASILAPGQRPPAFTLPAWCAPGHANVHGCDPTVPGLVEGVRAALGFAAAHPPLLGGDRPVAADRRGDRDEVADRFAARLLGWASSAGLLLPDAPWRRAAQNYALTGFFIHHRVPTPWDPEACHGEARADLAARYMIAVAAGDEAIFDRVLDGETTAERRHRLEASARFLRDALRGDGPCPPPPPVPEAALLAAIAATWREILRDHAACAPGAAQSFVAGLDALYAASLAEHRAPVGADLDVRGPAAPPRVRALADGASTPGERRVLRHLGRVSASVGAGPLFRAAALSAPASHAAPEALAILDEVTALLDYPFRLANDVSGFLDAASGDRDPKQNACAILVPPAVAGPAREAAVIEALATCRRLSDRLAAALAAETARLAGAWPWMGALLRRGVFVGRRVYEVGHYTTVSRAGMSAIFDEADLALGR